MGNIMPDIKPSGMTMKREVDLWYQLFKSLWTICDKLDDDATVPLTTYEANVWTAIFNASITDSKGSNINNLVKEENFYTIMPTGITDAARLQLIYQFMNMLETLTEQLDTDGITTSTYEALCYTAIMLHKVEDTKGNILGNGATFYFRPGGVMNQKELVEWFYNAVNAIETLTEKLDTDAVTTPPTDTDYEALAFTAIILTLVENAAGSTVGNNSLF